VQKYIAVAGNIGSGKSSLVHFLAKEYGAKPFFEPNEANPYFDDFYRDMKTWAFHSQLFFLAHKFRLHQAMEKAEGLVVLDRTIYEDAEIFATASYENQNIPLRDFELYWTLYQEMSSSLRPPDLMIYLKCSQRSLQKRIELRGREVEQNMPDAYLRRLQALYDNWIARYNHSEVITIETDKLDYVTDLVHRLDIMKRIERYF
jgi:deoxyadenosine/deoxycytidine kinase